MKRIASALLALYRREPSRANALAAGAVTWLVLRVGLDVDDATVSTVVPIVLTFLAGEATRWLVVPTATVDQVIADEVRVAEHTYPIPAAALARPEDIKPLNVADADWQPENPDVKTADGQPNRRRTEAERAALLKDKTTGPRW